MKSKIPVAILLTLAIMALIINSIVPHYQGGEIYEAANRAYGLLVKGFNVTIIVETTEGKKITGTLLSVKGSTISIVINGTTYTVGGPEATREDIKAENIQVVYHGKVYLYSVDPIKGTGRNVFSRLTPAQYYSVRYSGMIYISGNITPMELGELKYLADYKTYGSITINQWGPNGAIITANMVPIQYLSRYLGNYTIYTYGLLYVNSDERNMPFKLIEVRSP